MGIGGWDTDFDGDGSPAGTVTATSPRKGSIINFIRNGLILLGSLRHERWMTAPVRSLTQFPAVADTYEDHPEYIDVEVDWDKATGGTQSWFVRAYIECRVDNVATTVTPRVVLAGTNTLVGSAGSGIASTTWQEQYIDIPASTGVKVYRLQIKRSNLSFGVHVIARLRMYAPDPVP